MEIIRAKIDEIYVELVNKLREAPKVGNTSELNNVKFVLTDITNNIVSVRGISPSYLFGELLWYFNGDNSLEFISQFSSYWKRLSDDGKTCNSAYGYLIQTAYGFNQIDKVIKILKEDPNSRRAKININVPNANVDTTKDEPCTMSLHFMVRKNKLDCTAVMRSNDIWFGLPYDVAFFTELQKMIASKLNVGYGEYTHFAISLHMYERDEEALGKLIRDPALGFCETPMVKPIRFNRIKFYDNLEDLYLIAKHDGKETLMSELHKLGIYTEE